MPDDSTSGNARLRAALEEMQLYLSDNIPPLFFVESVKLLLESSPEIVGAAVVSWASNQVVPGAQLPTADYIFHAAKKLHILAELELLPEDVVKAWITSIRPALIDGCPPSDRQSLTGDLGRLDLNVSLSTAGSVEVVYRRTATEAGQDRPLRKRSSSDQPVSSESLEDVSRSVDQGLRRLDTLLQKLDAVEAQVPSGHKATSHSDGLTAEMVAQATEGAENAKELEKFLAELQKRGLPATADGLVKLLAQNLPDWAPPPTERAKVARLHKLRCALCTALFRWLRIAKRDRRDSTSWLRLRSKSSTVARLAEL